MAQVRAEIILLGLAVACSVPGFSQQPDLPLPPVLPTLSPPIPPRWILFPEPPSIPSPADAPIPDLGSLPGPPDKSRSALKRALDRTKPNCLDAAIHTCWSSPPGDGTSQLSKEDRDFAEDMDMGKYHFRNKNYRGAMFRFRHALELKPGEPEATFKLAESLNKLGKREEAMEAYQAYLGNQPGGAHAEQARAALEQLRAPKPKETSTQNSKPEARN
jgi:tetratricopeptide (TPR) repeat protein